MLRRLLIAAAFVLLSITSVSAQKVKLFGIAEQSGKITTAGIQSTNTAARTFPSATVTIRDAGTVTISTIWSDAAGTVPKANPFTASASDATWFAYVSAGRYDVTIAPTGGTPAPFTLSDITVSSATPSGASTVIACTGSDTAAFTTAISNIGAVAGTIAIPYSTSPCVVNNLTVPTNVTLDFYGGAGISINTGQTLSVYGPIRAPAQKIFFNATSGLGTVRFTDGTNTAATNNIRQKDYWVEWWGAVGDNATDSAAALNAAFAALPNGRTMRFASNGFYWVSTTVTVDHKFQVTILGNDSSVGYSDNFTKPALVWKGANGGTVLKLNNVYACTFRGFRVYGNDGVNLANGADVGIHLTFDSGVGYPGLSSHDYLQQLDIQSVSTRANWIGLNIDNATGANNEHHTIEDCLFIGGQDYTGTTQIGVRQGHAQVKAIEYKRNNFTSLGMGVNFQGSLRAQNNSFSNVGTMYHGVYVLDTNTIIGDDAEVVKNIFVAVEQPESTMVLIAPRVEVIHAAGTSAATAPIRVAGPTTIIGGEFVGNAPGVSPIPPYFVATINASPPIVQIINTNWWGQTADTLAKGFATCTTSVTYGSRTRLYGGSVDTQPERHLEAPPAYTSTRAMLNLTGENAVGASPMQIGDNEVGFFGIYRPNAFTITTVGTPGATVYRFTIVGRDSAGRRSTSYLTSTGYYIEKTTANALLDGTNYLRFEWPSQFPIPADWQIYQVNPANVFEWRLAATCAAVAGATQSCNIQSNPAGSYVPRLMYNESALMQVQAQVYFPNEITFTSLDATPSVAIGNDFVTANAGATTITNFDDGTTGQEIRIRINDANTTIQNNATIVTGTGADITAVNGAVYKFIRRGGSVWRRIL